MKVANDAIINKIVQKMKSLIESKANVNHKHTASEVGAAASDHTHEGVYSNGMRRTLNTTETENGQTRFTTPSNAEKMYSLIIGYSYDDYPMFTTVSIDWQMIGYDETIYIPYFIGEHFMRNDEAAFGVLSVYKSPYIKNSTESGKLTFTLQNGVHYIRRICGYV